MPTIGLSMIVKNGADSLAPCLESVRGIVQQIVIADTGSTDSTREIARTFGATIIQVPWENHFANARNRALEPVTTDWVLVLDADEEIDQDAKDLLPPLLAAREIGGYLVPIRNYVPTRFNRGWDRVAVTNDHRHPRANQAPAYVTHENCRLFRRRPDIYFAGRVHELVEDQITALGLEIRLAPFFIHHFGQLADQEAKAKKAAFYRELLRQKIEESPNDPFAWINFGLQEYESFNNAGEALRCFDRALALNPRASQAWLFTGMVQLKCGQPREALAALEKASEADSSATLRSHLKGDALFGLKRFEEARTEYRSALKLAGDDAQLESKLGFTEVLLGYKDAGIKKLKHASAAVPTMFEIHDRLIKAYIIADRLAEAANESEEFTNRVTHPRLFLRAASIHAQIQKWDKAKEILSRGLQMFAESPELRSAYDELMAKLTLDSRTAADRETSVSPGNSAL